MEAQLPTTIATLVGVVLLTLERLFHYVTRIMRRRALKCTYNNCYGLCNGKMDTSERESIVEENQQEEKEEEIKS